MCALAILQQVLQGSKNVLRQGPNTVIKKAPKWPELAAKRLMPLFMSSEQLRSYLPDWIAGKRERDRDFLWTLVWNLQPAYAKRLMNGAINIRAAAALEG
jgi:hypothetical protein